MKPKNLAVFANNLQKNLSNSAKCLVDKLRTPSSVKTSLINLCKILGSATDLPEDPPTRALIPPSLVWTKTTSFTITLYYSNNKRIYHK